MRRLGLLCTGSILLATAGASASASGRPPALSVSPTTLTFNAPVGGPNPAPQPVTIQNTGAPQMTWSATDDALWLSELPIAGILNPNQSQDMSVSVDVSGLAAGTYTGTITITATGATGSPKTVSVTLNVSATPTIGLSPTSLTFNAPLGGPNPATQDVTVSNTGTGTLNWSATDSETWMSLSPVSGSLSAGGSEPMTVAVDVAGLAAGAYTGTITVSDSGASNSPQTVSVTLNVSATPTIGLSPTSLTFTAPQGGPNPATQDVTVSNIGSGTLNWSAGDGETWLSESPASGSLSAGASQSMTVSVDVTGLAIGTYTGTITVSDSGASNTPQTVSVTLNVTDQPIISLNPTSLSFDAPPGGNPPAQAISVTNSGAGTLNWSASANAAWLGLSPTSGSLGSVQSAPITVSVNAAGLAAGTHTALITVSDPGAANNPQTVFVTLSVPPPPAPNEINAGYHCGAGGAELLAPLLLFAWIRRRRHGEME